MDTAPRLAIGVEAGADEFQFSNIHAVIRLRNGRVVITDGASRQVRLYDSTGRFVGVSGRPGQGPGEFGYSLMRMWSTAPNELWVNDDGNGRINVFTVDATHLRSFRVVAPAMAPRISAVGVFSDGTILSSGNIGGASTEARGRPGDINRTEYVYLQHSPEGAYLGEVLRYTQQPRYAHDFMGSATFSAVPFTQGALGAIIGNELAVYRGPGNEIEIWSKTGRVQRLVRWQGAPPRPTRDVWERYKVESLKRPGLTDLGRQLYREFHELPLPLPTHLPSIEALRIDDDRRIWARRYRLPWEANQVWDVISSDGEWLGAITTPRGLTVHQSGPDFVIGVHRDDLGIERVQLYTLVKP